MNNDTIKLLRECNLGCKMAVNSLNQISEYVTNPKFADLVNKSIEEHEKLGDETAQKLAEAGVEEKEPGTMTSAFSWFSTEVKMMMKDTDGEAAKIMIDGCSMGIQSIGEKKNHFKEAEQDAVKIASDLIKMEEALIKELESYL
ncbi:MAG: hypothetical protein IIV45_11850 [Lachnospiraceae bacterium]|nr:hypothetical protein [Lachnospiraceae bacterium]